MVDRVDIAVIGAGSAGYSCALRAAQLGLSVALFDDTEVGGTCLHRGCIPTKAWLHSAEVRRTVAQAEAFGIDAALSGVRPEKIIEHADQVVGGLHRGLQGLLSARGVQVIPQRAALAKSADSPAVVSGGETFPARAVVLATGATPSTLGLPVDGSRVVTSEQALRLAQLPKRAVVIGGGVIGVEFASLWTDLGVEVTLLEAGPQLLPAAEPKHATILAAELRKRGAKIELGVTVSDVTSEADQIVTHTSSGDHPADLVLVAVGRRPATAGLGLEQAGVRLLGTGHVEVDRQLATAAPAVFAAGDLVRGPQLAHRGYAHGIFLAERIAGLQGHRVPSPTLPADEQLPQIVYSSPQLASVGLTADQAGPNAKVVDYPLSANGRAKLRRPGNLRESGQVRLVKSPDGEIVGVHLVGEDVAELISEGALLVGWQATSSDLADIVHPHPSLSEAIAEANWALEGKPLHMHG